ncbi:MAG: GH32 C-terminal domain-containing protein [Planctomycetes bacterium]|nr:GH32 C-terminal domain-containing protein [Planctomycetota bacterium]
MKADIDFLRGAASLLATLPFFVLASAVATAENRPHPGRSADALVADFESETWGEWKSSGEAFGSGPAEGTLPGQMQVSGYRGKRLVNSFYKGDGTTGTLSSPAFRIERRYLNFLIGGGGYAGETCMNLVIDGKVVRTATGPNTRPGGSEALDWHSWDVSELEGRTASLEIVDRRTGGWGHINVDHIVQSDRRLQAEPAARELVIAQRYLHLPVKNGAAKRRMKFVVDDRTVREFDIELADDQPDFLVFSDVAAFSGRTLRIEVDRLPADSMGLDSIRQSDELPAADTLYRERHRPQFHFTSRRGWLNDPNGLVYHDGEWHLFYQHNPYGIEWGNMHWGHAVSRDLVHWRELPVALYPQRYGDWCFSGSGLIDERNTSGLGNGGRPPLIVAYTSTGRGEAIAFSHDRGRTFAEIDENPVVRHRGRDPKIIWHPPTERWVMAVYDEADDRQSIAFYASPDLKSWQYASRIDGFFECPDLFELPVDGDPQAMRWVLYAADGKYVLGRFDGREFHAGGERHTLWHGNFYAAQTFSNAPGGRRIQIGWGRGITFPGMPFNQQMTVPVELALRTTDAGVRMFAEPVPEIGEVRHKTHSWRNLTGRSTLDGIGSELLDIEARFEVDRSACGLVIHGVPVMYDPAKRELTCHRITAPLEPAGGRIDLRILVDRGSLEIFGNRGRVALSVGLLPPEDRRGVAIVAVEGTSLESLTIHELRSAWTAFPAAAESEHGNH